MRRRQILGKPQDRIFAFFIDFHLCNSDVKPDTHSRCFVIENFFRRTRKVSKMTPVILSQITSSFLEMFSLNSPHIDDVFWIETEGLSKPDVVEFPLSQGPFFSAANACGFKRGITKMIPFLKTNVISSTLARCLPRLMFQTRRRHTLLCRLTTTRISTPLPSYSQRLRNVEESGDWR